MTKNIDTQQEIVLDFEMTMMPGSTKSAMSAAGSSSRDLWQVAIENVRLIPNFNTRIKNQRYYDRVRLIANSMLQEGFKQDHPLAGYVAREGSENIIYLYAGHRRFEAVQIAIAEGADIKKVPFVIAPHGTSHEDLTVDLVTGNTGEELAPFEVAVVCKRLIGYGWDVCEIAKKLNLKDPYVNDLLLLMAAPKIIRDMVQSDEVAATKAIEILHKHGAKSVEVLQKSLIRAHAAGKTKVTGKFIPGAGYKKAIQKSAPVMVSALRDVQGDPGFGLLSLQNQEKLTVLLEALSAAERIDAEKESLESADMEGIAV